MYGGVEVTGEVSSELWAFDVNAKTWENITVKSDPCNTTSNSTLPCGKPQLKLPLFLVEVFRRLHGMY